MQTNTCRFLRIIFARAGNHLRLLDTAPLFEAYLVEIRTKNLRSHLKIRPYGVRCVRSRVFSCLLLVTGRTLRVMDEDSLARSMTNMIMLDTSTLHGLLILAVFLVQIFSLTVATNQVQGRRYKRAINFQQSKYVQSLASKISALPFKNITPIRRSVKARASRRTSSRLQPPAFGAQSSGSRTLSKNGYHGTS